MDRLPVENETPIRGILQEGLEQAGYELRDVGSADDAIDAITTHRRPCPVVATDPQPGRTRNGLDGAASMRRRLPEVPAIPTAGRPEPRPATRRASRTSRIVWIRELRDLVERTETVRASDGVS